jgi:hypothetical protein
VIDTAIKPLRVGTIRAAGRLDIQIINTALTFRLNLMLPRAKIFSRTNCQAWLESA